jgi:hypothetical protein
MVQKSSKNEKPNYIEKKEFSDFFDGVSYIVL